MNIHIEGLERSFKHLKKRKRYYTYYRVVVLNYKIHYGIDFDFTNW